MRTDLSTFLFSQFYSAMDAFDMPGSVNLQISADAEESTNETTDYLQKGERLLDMARTIYKRDSQKLYLTDVEKRIFSHPISQSTSMYDVIKQIANAFVRPCLRNMVSCDDEYAVTLLDAVSLPGLTLTMEYEEDPFYIPFVRKGVCGRKSLPPEEKILRVTFTEEGYDAMRIHGAKTMTHQTKDTAFRRLYEGFPYVVVSDLGYFFAALIIYVQVMKKLKEFAEIPAVKRFDNELYSQFVSVVDEHIRKYVRFSVEKYNISSDIHSITELAQYNLFIHNVQAQDKAFVSLLNTLGFNLIQMSKPSWKWSRKSFADPSCGIPHGADLAVCFLMRDDYRFAYHNLLFGNIEVCNLFWGLPKGFTYRNSSVIHDTPCMEVFVKLFRVISEQKYCLYQQEEYYKELEKGTHAKSYQLKKAIPGKVLKEMENSIFNEYFGFVEFDELTDIEKAQEIALEFKALKDTYLSNIDASQNAIRFRKLGNHKALGLYYPSVKCLCVDIHSPSSLTHEFGHLMDYSLGGLSYKSDFSKIRTMYTEYLEAGERDNTLGVSLKGKYNLNYYRMPTEIFARSFELYVAKVLNVRNSIVPEEFSNVYPQSAVFLSTVKEYFDALLQVNSEKTKTEGVSLMPAAVADR